MRPVLAKQMPRRPDAGRYMAPRLCPLSQHCRQLVQAVHIERRMHREHGRRATDERYIREVCDWVETPRDQRGENTCGQAGEQERVTTGRRTRDRNRRDLPTTTSLIFNQKRWLNRLVRFSATTFPTISEAANRERRHDAHGTIGPSCASDAPVRKISPAAVAGDCSSPIPHGASRSGSKCGAIMKLRAAAS